MSDTVLESLEQEVNVAFRQFAAAPTQSGRIKLRHTLLTIAGALDVEAANLPENEAMTLRIAITDMRALAELALVAPKEVLIQPQDSLVAAKPAPPPKPKPVVPPQLGKSLFRDLLGLFKSKR